MGFPFSLSCVKKAVFQPICEAAKYLTILSHVFVIRSNNSNKREEFRKSNWKFKMAFAMKGGGSRGGLECHIPILKNDFC